MSSNGTLAGEPTAPSETTRRPLREWVRRHDESWLFVGGYVTLAVVLSIWISLFWLVAVVAVHFAFELIRQLPHFATRREVLGEALWEVKLDIALVVFAFVISLYMELVLGILGLRSAAQLGAAVRGGSRIAGWQSAIRGALLSVDDAVHVVRSFFMRKGGGDAPSPPAVKAEKGPAEVPPPGLSIHARWTAGDWFSLSLLVSSALLVLLSPAFTEHTLQTALETLALELHPFPQD